MCSPPHLVPASHTPAMRAPVRDVATSSAPAGVTGSPRHILPAFSHPQHGRFFIPDKGGGSDLWDGNAWRNCRLRFWTGNDSTYASATTLCPDTMNACSSKFLCFLTNSLRQKKKSACCMPRTAQVVLQFTRFVELDGCRSYYMNHS